MAYSSMATVGQLSPSTKEGFLCPICLKDMVSAELLARHFENAHGQTETDDGDVIHQMKGFFGKAKKFFTFDDDNDDNDDNNDNPDTREVVDYARERERSWSAHMTHIVEPQEPGATRALTEYFKRFRDAKVDKVVVDTNKMIIRLSKLSGNDLPEDGPKRKAFEQKIVPWAEDNSCKTCLTCGKSFGLRRRRHHCRLCGEIICDSCSEFLPISQAKIFTSGVSNPEISGKQTTFVPRRGSTSSVNSIGTQETGPTLRTCSKCRKLLEIHRNKQEQRYGKTKVTLLYEELQKALETAERITPEYNKMARSLLAGETSYNLEAAAALRQQIAKQYSAMDLCSKRILNLGTSDEENFSETALRVQTHIRAFCTSYIQDHTAVLPHLPDEKQLKELISLKDEQRKIKIQKELQEAEEIRKRLQRQELHTRKTTSLPRQPINRQVQVSKDSVTNDGWKPGEIDSKLTTDDDPMVQQINIIKGYLKQAKQAERWDEAEMLEDNLKQLEDEFYQVQS